MNSIFSPSYFSPQFIVEKNMTEKKHENVGEAIVGLLNKEFSQAVKEILLCDPDFANLRTY